MLQDDAPEERRHSGDKRLKLDTTIGIAHILTTIAMVVSMFTFISDMRTTIAINVMEISSLKAERTREVKELKENIQLVSNKIDRLMERNFSPVTPTYKLDSHRYLNGG